MGVGRRHACAVLAAVAVGSLSGCTADPRDPLVDAQSLADAIAENDVADVWFAGQSADDVQAQVTEITAGMGPALVRVTATQASIDEPGDAPSNAGTEGARTATATLAYDWDLDGAGPETTAWTYATEVRLVQADQDDDMPWQVVWSPEVVHPALTDGVLLRSDRTQPPRADVVGAGGEPLVTARPVERIGIDKVRVDDDDLRSSARELARAVGIDPPDYVSAVEQAGPEAFVEAIVLRQPEAESLRSIVESIPGGRLISTELPLAPTREFARQLLGVVGEATAELVADSAGAIAPGDTVGLSGLQLRYDEQLRGTPGFTVVAAADDAASTAATDELHRSEPVTGSPLVVTLDQQTQQLADDLLVDVGPPSALVAVRPSTAELIAVASGPGGNGYSTATLGQYAPGSVFKIATSLALLRAGLTPDSPLPCTESLEVDGTSFGNYSDYPADALGDITLRRAFAESCNTAFLSQSDVVDDEALARAAASLGIGGTDDLGFDAYLGTVGQPRNEVERAASLIGQGAVLLSPLAAATMAASTDTGPLVPVLITSAATPAPSGVEPVRQQESDALTSMMRSAVTDGTADVLDDVPGASVVAKTGTAEYGTADPPDTHGWMVAVQDDLAVAVFVEEAESGSGTAGPIMRDFLTQVGRAP